MLDTILGLLGGQGAPNQCEEKPSSGLGDLLPLIFLGILIIGGLKLLKAKEAPPPPPPPPDCDVYQ